MNATKNFHQAIFTVIHSLSICGLFTWLASSSSLAQVQAQGQAWITFEKCPVKVEHTLEIPAQERGFLRSLNVELNQVVTTDQVLAELDTDLAELELEMAKLELAQASELARDDSGVKLQTVTLQQVKVELENYRSISNSVSESELRRLILEQEQAEYGVKRAQHAQGRAIGEEKLKAAAVEVAKLRLARRRIVAPHGGEVTAIKIQSGQSVEAGQTILEIEDLEHLIIYPLIPINKFNVADLNGAEVRVDVAQPGADSVRLAGQITSYDPHVSSGGLVRIHARVKNMKRGNVWVLLPGSEVTMHVSRTKPADASQAKASISSRNVW